MSEQTDQKQKSGTEIIRRQEALYRLIISQLYYDGHHPMAITLQSSCNVVEPCPPSDRLSQLVQIGLAHEPDRMKRMEPSIGLNPIQEILIGPGLDLEFESDIEPSAPEPAQYETAYVTSHKSPCRAGAFSIDGQLCATGSVDASIKILDVDRMLAKSSMDSAEPQNDQQGHPVIRTLYDHIEEVTCLEFHPSTSILASGSKDKTVKMFDYSKSSVRKAHKTIQESTFVRCLSFHPSGDYMVVGTDHFVLRMYDTSTTQCFVCCLPSSQHTQAITTVKYSQDGRIYCSGSKDGDIKIWDGVSSKCVATFTKAHDGAEISSLIFTRNGKYLLSSGKDSLVKLWELSSARCLIAYTGAASMGQQVHRAQAVFNHTEDYVLFPNEATTSLCTWNSRNAARQSLLSLGHNGVVRHICHAPTSAAFLTCSDDFRARFWYKRQIHGPA